MKHHARIWIVLAAAIAVWPLAARAAGQTITVWWNQGFYQAEDEAFRQTVADWEKATGNKMELTFHNGSVLPAKIISAMTVGDVPDVVYSDTADFLLIPQSAWNDRLEDVGSVVETQKGEYTETALLAARLYNNVRQKRAFYTVPLKHSALHEFIWRPMVEKAGYKIEEIPRTINEFYDFFQDVQKKLRGQGSRVFGLGFSMATKEDDSLTLFHSLLVGYGGAGIVTPDGKLHVDDPVVREAAIKAIRRLTTPYKEGFVPPGAINWGDPDNNSAFYARQVVMTPNATLSIPVAQLEKTEQYYNEIVTLPPPLGEDGKARPTLTSVKAAFIPKGAKNIDTAKAFLTYLIQPKVLGAYLANARGRWLPPMPVIVKNDPFWTDPKDPHRKIAIEQVLNGPTLPYHQVFNPAYGEVGAEHVWVKAEADVTQNGMTPEAAVDKAIERIKVMFAKYRQPAE